MRIWWDGSINWFPFFVRMRTYAATCYYIGRLVIEVPKKARS